MANCKVRFGLSLRPRFSGCSNRSSRHHHFEAFDARTKEQHIPYPFHFENFLHSLVLQVKNFCFCFLVYEK